MFRFSEKQKDKVADLFFDGAKYIITGSVLVEMYSAVSDVRVPAILAGAILATGFTCIGLIIIGERSEKKGGKK
ncbi:MAG: hypothetical protein FWE23_09605 [Chitinivibrionia bacterium]|nr:hypothetical protein [Chitinivibrionia bacterium]